MQRSAGTALHSISRVKGAPEGLPKNQPNLPKKEANQPNRRKVTEPVQHQNRGARRFSRCLITAGKFNKKVSVYLTFYRKCFSNLVLTKNFEHMPNELISHSG